MPTTPTDLYNLYGAYDPFKGFFSTAIGRLRNQRAPDSKPKKPKPVTDEQLLAVVDELQAKIAAVTKEFEEAKKVRDYETQRLHTRINETKEYVEKNYRLKLFAPTKRTAGFGPTRG